jgi:hypothetical protein
MKYYSVPAAMLEDAEALLAWAKVGLSPICRDATTESSGTR